MSIERVAVLGGGLMGSGIAEAIASPDCPWSSARSTTTR
jgi:3-hydroxyacyl-CoA dehydrogenase